MLLTILMRVRRLPQSSTGAKRTSLQSCPRPLDFVIRPLGASNRVSRTELSSAVTSATIGAIMEQRARSTLLGRLGLEAGSLETMDAKERTRAALAAFRYRSRWAPL